MTFHAYTPEPPLLNDVLLAYQQFTAPRVGALVEPDPLGPVNQIVTLMVGDRRVRSALWPVPAGVEVKVERETGGYRIEDLFALRGRFLTGEPLELPGRRPRGWYVLIDGHTVLAATDAEIWPPTPTKPVSWRVRARGAVKRWLSTPARNVTDRVARRLGYVRDDEYGWDE